jgi:hypothetical protein
VMSLWCWQQQGRWSEGSRRSRGSRWGSAWRGEANSEICKVIVAWSSSYRLPESLLRTGSSGHGRSAQNWTQLLELCPRGNNKHVIIIILVHDNVYIPCYNCIK